MNKKIDDAGLGMKDEQINVLKNLIESILTLHPNLELEDIILLSSSGASVVITADKLRIVYQHYLYTDVARIYDIGTKLNCRYILKPIYVDIANSVIVWRKVIPVVNLPKKFLTDNADKLLIEMSIARDAFVREGFCHGDMRIDNIGYSEGVFVLFDFDSVKKLTPGCLSRDLETLEKSIKFHI